MREPAPLKGPGKQLSTRKPSSDAPPLQLKKLGLRQRHLHMAGPGLNSNWSGSLPVHQHPAHSLDISAPSVPANLVPTHNASSIRTDCGTEKFKRLLHEAPSVCKPSCEGGNPASEAPGANPHFPKFTLKDLHVPAITDSDPFRNSSPSTSDNDRCSARTPSPETPRDAAEPPTHSRYHPLCLPTAGCLPTAPAPPRSAPPTKICEPCDYHRPKMRRTTTPWPSILELSQDPSTCKSTLDPTATAWKQSKTRPDSEHLTAQEPDSPEGERGLPHPSHVARTQG